MSTARVIAYYLPQFHPIPENDIWWGKGFTEWTNVGKAKPLFKGHYQPRVPADLGYYDLRLPEVRHAQAEMARYAGVEGFAYWHYWWAGKRLLEKPYDAMLADKSCTLPFCIAWANETWSGVWHGDTDRILMEQTYPGREDHTQHFYSCLASFQDERYIRVNGKPLFIMYRPLAIPDAAKFFELWNELAMKEGLPGIHFVAICGQPEKEIDAARKLGYDGINTFRAGQAWKRISGKLANYIKLRISEKYGGFKLNRYEYADIVKHMHSMEDREKELYPTILPQWDNSARSGRRSVIYTGATPKLFKTHLQKTIDLVRDKPTEERLIFLKSWNEWAEGNYVEPDIEFGWGYLDALRRCLVENSDLK